MKVTTSIIFFLIVGRGVFAQAIQKSEADSLVEVLEKTNGGVERIDLLLRLAQYHIFKPGELQVDFDSATIYISEAAAMNKSIKSSTARGSLLLTESYLAKEKGLADEAKKMVRNAVTILESGNNKAELGKAYLELSRHCNYNVRTELEEKIRLVELASACFQQIDDQERIGASHHELGDLYHILGNYPKALDHLKLALVAYKTINHVAVQGIYSLMGTISVFLGDNRQALDYGLLALQTAENVGDTSLQLCQINNGIGRTLVRLKERQKATNYFSKALEIAEKYRTKVQSMWWPRTSQITGLVLEMRLRRC
jgi:two-component system, sensor histidine kinase PdtaS